MFEVLAPMLVLLGQALFYIAAAFVAMILLYICGRVIAMGVYASKRVYDDQRQIGREQRRKGDN